MSIYGPLWHPGILEEAAMTTLKAWLPTYLAEVCRQEAERLNAVLPEDADEIPAKQLPAPQSWGTASEYDRFPETGLPAIIVAAPGMDGTPARDGDGFFSAPWVIEVSVTLQASTGADARRNAQLYLAAILGAILQRRSLGDDMSAARLVDVDYVDVPGERRRTQVAAAAAFVVDVDHIVSDLMGPVGPPPAPPAEVPDEWPEVNETHIETEIQ